MMGGLIKVLGGDDDMKPCTSLDLKTNYKVGTYFTSQVTFCVKEAEENPDGGYTYRVELDNVGKEKVVSAPKEAKAKKSSDEQDVEEGLKSVEAPDEKSMDEGDY